MTVSNEDKLTRLKESMTGELVLTVERFQPLAAE